MKRSIILLFALALCLGAAGAASASPINLSDWSEQGTGSGTWTVAADGSSVYQSVNGDPTYFVSNTNYINTQFEGSFAVETTYDDDFIGFVFGWNGLTDYYLFDWKQATQSSNGVAYEGFTLSKISGADVNLWGHTGDDLTVLDTLYGSTLGWVDRAVNTFLLDYTENGLSITVNGQLIFSESGSFQSGKFGFYNYSQSGVRYQGFEEEVIPPAVPEPGTFVLLAAGLLAVLGYAWRRRSA